MNNFDNTFVRGPSPSYSEDALSVTLPGMDSKADAADYFDEKFNYGMVESDSCSHIQSEHKGRNTFAFWTVVLILLALTIGNMILTLTIIGVLRLGKGVHGMEVIPEVDVIKFYGSTDLDRVVTKSIGQIDGFTDVPVTISSDGDDSAVHVRVYRAGIPNDRIVVDKNGIVARSTNVFEVKDPIDRLTLFSTHRPQYNIPGGVNELLTKAASTIRITSPLDKPLVMESNEHITLKGSEGIAIDAATTLFQAEHQVSINSTSGSTILEAGTGIFLDMDRIPIVSSEMGIRTGSVQYKICVCMPQGTLFRIAIPRVHNGPKISCSHFNAKEDPCVA